MFAINGNGKEVAELFKKFGLNEYESRVYFTLQVNGKTKAGRLWQPSGVPQSRVYNAIQTLSMKGLVETTNPKPLEVRAKPFVRFANEYMNDKKCLLYEIQERIGNYKEASKNRFLRVVV